MTTEKGCINCAKFTEQETCTAEFIKGIPQFCILDLSKCKTCEECNCKSFELKQNKK